jgi:hypothetical protein
VVADVAATVSHAGSLGAMTVFSAQSLSQHRVATHLTGASVEQAANMNDELVPC